MSSERPDEHSPTFPASPASPGEDDVRAQSDAEGTPRRLRRAAASLLAERSWPEITLRDITESAGANVASVGYHFGSKNALLAAVMREAVMDMTQRQASQLEALDADADLEAVVAVWLAPAFQQPTDAAVNGQPWDIVRRHFDAAAPEVAQAYADAGEVVEQFLTPRLRRLLPHLNEDELRMRHVGVLAATAALTGRHPAQEVMPTSAPDPNDIDTLRAVVITFACGALRAPAGTRDTNA